MQQESVLFISQFATLFAFILQVLSIFHLKCQLNSTSLYWVGLTGFNQVYFQVKQNMNSHRTWNCACDSTTPQISCLVDKNYWKIFLRSTAWAILKMMGLWCWHGGMTTNLGMPNRWQTHPKENTPLPHCTTHFHEKCFQNGVNTEAKCMGCTNTAWCLEVPF